MSARDRRRPAILLSSEQKRILSQLRIDGPMSRTMLAVRLGIHNGAMTRISRELIALDLLESLRAIITDTPWQDLYWALREQVDLGATYTMKSGVAIFGQLANATYSRLTSLTGPNKNLLKDSYSVPTTLWLGLRFTPRF